MGHPSFKASNAGGGGTYVVDSFIHCCFSSTLFSKQFLTAPCHDHFALDVLEPWRLEVGLERCKRALPPNHLAHQQTALMQKIVRQCDGPLSAVLA